MRIKYTLKKAAGSLQGQSGFSFPEILVAITIFTFLAAAINTVLSVGNSSWQSNSVEVELQQDLRQAMQWMKNDIQQTGSASLDASVPINVAPDSVTYPNPDDDPAYNWNYYYTIAFQKVTGATNGVVAWSSDTTQFFRESDSSDPDYNTVERTVGAGAPQKIAENISQIQVRRLYDSSDVFEVALQAQKKTLSGAQGRTLTLTLDFKVQLRN